MPKFLSSLMLLFWATIAQTQTVNLQYRELYVNDFADLLSDTAKIEIRDQLETLHDEHGIEFTVVTIQNMSNHSALRSIEPFATALFNRWGVGDATRNDGVMLLVSRYDRVLRIEVGSGYGALKDKPMEDIIDNYIVPYFKRDKYEEGITRGVEEIIYDLTGIPPGYEDASALSKASYSVTRFIDRFVDWLLGAAAGAVVALIVFWRRVTRRFPRKCPIDGSKMIRLDEVEDDAHLNEGERAEENLGSKDYDIWACQSCNHVRKISFRSLFSKYGACWECGYRTAGGESTIVSHATTTSTGSRRIDYTCAHCKAEYTVFQTIPKVSKSSSSGGGSSIGGGSSFGGGRSSGGGASGSW